MKERKNIEKEKKEMKSKMIGTEVQLTLFQDMVNQNEELQCNVKQYNSEIKEYKEIVNEKDKDIKRL